MDLDLAEVENIAKGADARSSRFNPRLQPRARPRPQARSAAKALAAAQPHDSAPAPEQAAPVPAPVARPQPKPRAGRSGTGGGVASAARGTRAAEPGVAAAPAGPDLQLPALTPLSAEAEAAPPSSAAASMPSASGTAVRHADADEVLRSGDAGASRSALMPLLTEGLGPSDAPQEVTQADGRAAAATEQPARGVARKRAAATAAAKTRGRPRKRRATLDAAAETAGAAPDKDEGAAVPVQSPEADANVLVPFEEDEPDEGRPSRLLLPTAGAGARQGGRARTKASERRARQKGVKTEGAAAEGGAARGKSLKPRLADKELDVGTMSLKEVIRWQSARERAKLADERRLREEAGILPELAPAVTRHVDPRERTRTVTLAPQVTFGPDGQLIVNEAMLTVQAQPEEVIRRNVVSEQPMLNSQSYAVNRSPSERWTPEETENFFAALKTFGTDFTLISRVFCGRTRRQIKNKYTKESKVNPERIDDALKGGSTNDFAYREVLQRVRGESDNTVMLALED